MLKRRMLIIIFCMVALGIMLSCNLGSQNDEPSTITKIVLPSTTHQETVTVSAVTQLPKTLTKVNQTPTNLSRPVRVQINTIRMIDVVNGWAIGVIEGNPNDLVLRTLDGGTSWKNVTPIEAASSMVVGGQSAVAFFLDASHAWAIFSPKELSQPAEPVVVWNTQDGGKTWIPSQPIDLSKYQMDFFKPASLGFASDQSGWLMAHLGAGMGHDYIMVLTSQDYGITWKPVVTPEVNNLPMACAKSGIQFMDVKKGWITGNCPGLMPGVYFYQTIDGGSTWQPVNLPIPTDQPDVFNTDTIGCGLPEAPAVLENQFVSVIVRCEFATKVKSQAWVYTSRDAGIKWQPLLLPSSTGNLQFMTDLIAWYLGSVNADGTGISKLERSIDGGHTWQSISRVTWNGPIQFINSQIGWVIAHIDQASTLVKTTNGGGTWHDLQPFVVP